MSNKEKTAAAVASQPDVAEKLDSIMTCPNDRAYVICKEADCLHNIKGECTIFTVLDEIARRNGEPCTRYVKVI
jgi:hypothetical protein